METLLRRGSHPRARRHLAQLVRDAQPVPVEDRAGLRQHDHQIRTLGYTIQPIDELSESSSAPGASRSSVATQGSPRRLTREWRTTHEDPGDRGRSGRHPGRSTAAQARPLGGCTATTPGKVNSLLEKFDEVLVLRGSDREAMRSTFAGREAVVVAAGPPTRRSSMVAPRGAGHGPCREIPRLRVSTSSSSARSVQGTAPYQFVALSSTSVWADGPGRAERRSPNRACSPADRPGPDDLPGGGEGLPRPGRRARLRVRCRRPARAGGLQVEAKVAMARPVPGRLGALSGDALLYRLAVEDAADAVVRGIESRITGVHNLTHAEVPPTNSATSVRPRRPRTSRPSPTATGSPSPQKPISVAPLAPSGSVTRPLACERRRASRAPPRRS